MCFLLAKPYIVSENTYSNLAVSSAHHLIFSSSVLYVSVCVLQRTVGNAPLLVQRCFILNLYEYGLENPLIIFSHWNIFAQTSRLIDRIAVLFLYFKPLIFWVLVRPFVRPFAST